MIYIDVWHRYLDIWQILYDMYWCMHISSGIQWTEPGVGATDSHWSHGPGLSPGVPSSCSSCLDARIQTCSSALRQRDVFWGLKKWRFRWLSQAPSLTCYGRISWYHLVTWVSDMVSSQHMHVWWCFACMFSEGSMFHYFSYGLHPGSFSLSLLLRGGLLLRGARHHSGRAWLLISPRRQRREAVMVFDVFWVNVWIIMLV